MNSGDRFQELLKAVENVILWDFKNIIEIRYEDDNSFYESLKNLEETYFKVTQ